jgi:transporter family-2 protein
MRDVGLGLLAAVAAGATFSAVTAIEGMLARLVGAVRASVLENIAAGLISAGLLVVILAVSRGGSQASMRPALPLAVVAGTLVVIAVAGIGYAIPRLGVAAGNIAIVFGQMVVAVLIDTLGWGGYDPIPLKLSRILGLLLLAGGMLLVLPRFES